MHFLYVAKCLHWEKKKTKMAVFYFFKDNIFGMDLKEKFFTKLSFKFGTFSDFMVNGF